MLPHLVRLHLRLNREPDFEAALGVNLCISVERETSPADSHRRSLPSKLRCQVLVVGAVKGLLNLGKRGFVRGGSESEAKAKKLWVETPRFGTTRSGFSACARL